MSGDLLAAVNEHFVKLSDKRIRGVIGESRYITSLSWDLMFLETLENYSQMVVRNADLQEGVVKYGAEAVQQAGSLLLQQTQRLYIRTSAALADCSERKRVRDYDFRDRHLVWSLVRTQVQSTKFLLDNSTTLEAIDSGIKTVLKEFGYFADCLDAYSLGIENQLSVSAVLASVRDLKEELENSRQTYAALLNAK